MSGALTPAQIPAYPVRFCNVPGYDCRRNDVVYCHPVVQTEEQTTVVFFGGDVQDFTENMQSHRDNKNYVKWNLEDMARIIQKGFLDSHVVVVRPSRMEYKTFSCYDNFVPCINCGAPEHTPTHNALHHLKLLLQNMSEKLRAMSSSEFALAVSKSKTTLVQESMDTAYPVECDTKNDTETKATAESVGDFWWKENVNLDKYSIKLIGFSKGCVVLNQLLYEFHYLKTLTPDDPTMLKMVEQIKEMYWLDGGHSGGKNTWITSRPLLETLTRLGIVIHIHVTPYQIQDDRRPWIKKEEKSFHDILCQLGAPVNRVVHFVNTPPNLFMHFDVLITFKQVAADAKSTNDLI